MSLKANVNEKDSVGLTPMHVASGEGSAEDERKNIETLTPKLYQPYGVTSMQTRFVSRKHHSWNRSSA